MSTSTDSKTRKEKVLDALADGEWMDGYDLCHPAIGGSEGLRRVRELRSDGYKIEKRRKKGSTAYQYRLVTEEKAKPKKPASKAEKPKSEPKQKKPRDADVRENRDWFMACACVWKESASTSRMIRMNPRCKVRPHPGVVRH